MVKGTSQNFEITVIGWNIMQKNQNENELYAHLIRELGENQVVKCHLTPKEKKSLVHVRSILDKEWSYETPFEWGEIVVNTNWLSSLPLTIIYSRKYYKTIKPVVNE
ncbi:MAG: hypothetical protein ACKPH3_07560 [Dolichospermum sp.]